MAGEHYDLIFFGYFIERLIITFVTSNEHFRFEKAFLDRQFINLLSFAFFGSTESNPTFWFFWWYH